MPRDLSYWKEKLEEAIQSLHQLQFKLQSHSWRHSKTSPARVRTFEYKTYDGHLVVRYAPIKRRGKLINKLFREETMIGKRTIKTRKRFNHKNYIRWESAKMKWIKEETCFAKLRKDIKKVARQISYYKTQISRLESK